MQNIKIFQKYNVNISIASFAQDEYELRSWDALKAFAKVLGVGRVVTLKKILKDKQDKSAGKIVNKNVRIVN